MVKTKIQWFFVFILFLAANVGLAAPIKVMTFNAWLMPSYLKVSQDSVLRRSQMPASFEASGADIIALQEVWTRDDQDFLISEMSKRGYPYSARVSSGEYWYMRFAKGFLGNGLLILSRYEIRNPERIFLFSRHTRSEEYFAAKGVMRVEIKLPEVDWVDFYNAHLGAIYFDHSRHDWIQDHVESNFQQGREMLQFIQDTKTSPVQMVAGDFNLHPDAWDPEVRDFSRTKSSHLYALLTEMGSAGFPVFYDTFHAFYPRGSGHFTYDQRRNSYVGVWPHQDEPSIFCDYVFINRDQKVLEMQGSKLAFDEPYRHEGGGSYFLSDHFGVLSTFDTAIP